MLNNKSIQLPVGRFGSRTLFVLGTVLFLCTEGIALFVLSKKSEMNVGSYFLPYVVALWVPVPWITLTLLYRRLKRGFAQFSTDERLRSSVSVLLFLAIEAAYLGILFSLLLLLTASHAKG
jgi:hypothetical protein